jgi:uncharacterized protein (TIGR02646 family)
MKPVNKGGYIGGFRDHGDAKPDLLARLGHFCSYCESSGSPQQLHVEHIYQKATTAHPKLKNNWHNFLLACPTCNTYKSHHLGNGRQTGLLKRFLWPHLDNTFAAFDYDSSGRVFPNPGLPRQISGLARDTITMVGLMQSPAAAVNYAALGIAYDGASKRSEAWEIAKRARDAYLQNPSPAQLRAVCDACYCTGHFSIWMAVFYRQPIVRHALITKCKADPVCFDATTSAPIVRGRA